MRDRPPEASKVFNCFKSSIRALVEYMFGNMVMTMHGMSTRLIGLYIISLGGDFPISPNNRCQLIVKVA